MKAICHWNEDDGLTWRTDCEQEHSTHDGSPDENGWEWCPYCGGSLILHPYDDEDVMRRLRVLEAKVARLGSEP